MEKVLIRLMLAVLILVFLAPAIQSELLVYEPFDYPVGDLAGNSGAFGLVWGWQDWWGEIPSQVGEGSLIHPMYEIEGIGNHGQIIDGGVGEGFPEDNYFYDDGQDIWMSFLYQYVPGSVWGSCTMFFWSDELWALSLDLTLSNGTPGLSSLYTGQGGTVVVADPEAVMWIVVKAETSGSSSTTEMAYLWVDPSPDMVPSKAEADIAVEYDIQHGSFSNHFHWQGSGDPMAYRFDEIRVGREFEDVIVQLPCENASAPQPVNGAERVEIDLQALDWKAPACVDDPTYDVYFGSDANSLLWEHVYHGTKTRWNIDFEDDLEYETTYYWRVDVIEPNETGEIIYPGRTWRFTTLSLKPVFLTQPKSTTVAADSDVQFTVDVFNSNDQEWYYSETPDGEGTLIPDVNSFTLDLASVQLADEGYYYCKAWNNDLGMINTAYSNRARLLTERPMAHWKFEDNLDDEIDPLNNGVPIGPVGYVVGIDGQAVLLDDPDYIQTTNDLGELTEFTVSMWIKPDSLSGRQTLLTATGSTERGALRLRLSDDEFLAEVLGGVSIGGTLLTPAQWNHCVFIYDTSTRWSGLYLNGSPVNTATTPVAPLMLPLSIGSNDGLENYNGLIDDLRIYDYRISDLEVASLYTGFMPEEDVCLGNPAYDLSDNCRVDLEDLGLILSEWLNCHIVPTCLQ